ncbi:hypothetical protein PEX2_063710 [Penicillium expansum]|uniref:Uncharacterized protein n=1 Tax=Penicillium expansum TaxID=27334 RepID=A0A0A2J632_PENEN|nr:hypothetical protein PEX2_063710 [Penicillium expansum]KGO50784.1 hypothetical protein PEX2_063710 [Penicillium expansum]
MPLRLPKWLEKLQGKLNWSQWRKGLHDAFLHVDPASWDVIMNRLDDTTIKQEPVTIREAEAIYLLATEQDDSLNATADLSTSANFNGELDSDTDENPVTDDEPVVTVARAMTQSVSTLSGAQQYQPRRTAEPLAVIERFMDAHEAYVKLESLYGKTSAQFIHIAWEKFSRVRYSAHGLTPAAFVDRFQKSLRDVKDQCVEVPPTVELAQFQQAIKPNPNPTTFMPDMKVDIYDPNFMNGVYADFLEDQPPTC